MHYDFDLKLKIPLKKKELKRKIFICFLQLDGNTEVKILFTVFLSFFLTLPIFIGFIQRSLTNKG